MNKSLLAAATLALLLAGCASQRHVTDNSQQRPAFDPYAECTLPTTRDAGMGVKVESCHAWTFGPTRAQAARFGKQH